MTNKMKVLITSDRHSYMNPFVWTLADGISEQGVNVTCSLDDFWHDWQKYDVIHLQWPNMLVKGLDTIAPLKSHLQSIKDAGKPMVVTCHNLHPHYSKRKILNEAYDVVYDAVDCFIHMGNYSCELFKSKYPKAKHVIIPHHVYDKFYCDIPSKEEAVKYLKFNPNQKYILCFGAFRHDEEREIAIKASKIMERYNGKVIAPAFSKYGLHKNIVRTVKEYVRHLWYKVRYKNLLISKGFVSDEELPFYYAASDIALIHRREILNSGNLPMAFYMGKVVMGPNVGNVGDLLDKTSNPTFDIHNIDSLEDTIEKAWILNEQGKGVENRKYALDNFATERVAQQHVDLYQSLI